MSDLNQNVVTFEGSFSTNQVTFGGTTSGGGSPTPDTPTSEVDYETQVINRPAINGVTLIGNKTTNELNIKVPTDNAQLNNGAGYTKKDEFVEYPASELAALWKSKFGS